MGYRLHARKINHIEYTFGVFNNMGDVIIPLLRDFPGDHWESEDESRMEIDKDDFREGIQILEKMTEKKINEEYPGVLGEYMTKKDLVDTLSFLLKESEPRDNVVSLDWY